MDLFGLEGFGYGEDRLHRRVDASIFVAARGRVIDEIVVGDLVVDHEAPRHLFITYAAALEGFATRHRADGADGRGCRALRRAVAVEIRANGRIEQVAAKAVRGKALAVRTGPQRPAADEIGRASWRERGSQD